MDAEVEEKWGKVEEMTEERFGEKLDLQSIIFIIGLQELGKDFRRYSKDEKIDIMHVAICTLLKPYGYYDYIGHDEEGWPHYERTDKLPHLKPAQQSGLVKKAIVDYFEI